MPEAISFRVDWKTWNAKLAKLKGLPKHMQVMAKSVTIFGVETLKKTTPRSKTPGDHLADAWTYQIKGLSPIRIQIYNAQRARELVLRILEYGSEPHEITPRAREWMRFEWRGRLCFAKHVEHPGTPAYHMISQTRYDLEARIQSLKGMLVRRFAQEVEGAR